ncbi:glycosyltransferase [Cellulophaga sp. F20128]|uniref:glycosyltransferase family 2 protein n=1 Tax=Cellulophaga sp. F20128 TaxID=2926413 RepID=UPI001FF2F80C|nr:glycosyltransferase family A protein [Cellulophaga sp. F20128]MCK0156170.1 glycosyltransferase [Cellulophaga sp. F20128]
MKYYIILPAHNEEAFLAATLSAVLQQTLLPQKVIIVNDNSTDATENIIDDFVLQNSIFQKLNTTSSTQHLPGSKVINAFNKGLAVLDANYDFIVKLDADIILPSTYFDRIASIFRSNPTVGIAGGFAYEQDATGEWKLNHPMNKDHVRGAFKAYTKSCFTQIKGLRNAMGWDTVDELLAQYNGFTIFTDDSLQVKHLRPTGGAYNKQAKLLQGKAMFSMRYGFTISCIASLKMALKQKRMAVFFNNLKGYQIAKKEKLPFLVTPKEGNFIRHLRWTTIKSKLF